MKSANCKNTVLNAALKLIKKDSEDSRVTSYDILYGYSRLFALDESLLCDMFDEKECRDLTEARRFLFENKLDGNLLRKGLPYIIPYVEEASIEDKPDSDVEGMSSYEILSELLDGDDSILEVFKFGKSMEDVFSLQDDLQKKHSDDNKSKHSPKDASSDQDEETAPDTSHEEIDTADSPSTENESSSRENAASSVGSSEMPEKSDADSENMEREAPGKTDNTKSEVESKGPAESHHTTRKEKSGKSGKEKFNKLSETYRSLRISLLETVKGQRGPVAEFVQGCYQGEVLSTGEKRKNPKNVFLFVGPPGVGKTLLAQTAAESLGYPSMTFNMSEYSSSQSHEGLIGVSPIYNTAQEGRLVQFVRENPFSILIFDEIEKAHRNTIQIFLQILDQGTADNAYRKEKTDFSETTIIFTSNACRSIYETGQDNLSTTPKSVILDALRNEKDSLTGEKVFPSSICSRIAAGNIIMFNYLHSRDMMHMVSDNFEKTAEQIRSDFGYNVDVDPKLSTLFMFHQGGLMDARIAARQSDKFIKNELYELTRQLESHPTLLNGINMLKFELGLDSGDTPGEIQTLFTSSLKLEMAVMCREEDRKYFALPEEYKVHFAHDEEEMRKLLNENLMLILIDLKVGITKDTGLGVSLDDYDSVGIRTFEMLGDEGNTVPVYIFTPEETLTEADINTFLRRGADGVVKVIGDGVDSVKRQVSQFAEEAFMDHQVREFSRQGKVLKFNTAQITDGNTLVILYHALRKVQALDSESAESMLLDADRPDVRFDDVIGAENAKEELKYFIKYLSNPRKFINDGGKPAKGLLLYGPPGTGKTMLARAMAGETDFSFIQTSATEFLNKWLGQSEQNVRDLFKRAKKYAPSIIFIDEIDAIGKERTGEDRNIESVLNALLTEMDGFKTDIKKPVFVIAATNYKVERDGDGRMSLDPALVRRFDNRIYVDLPNEKERTQYLTLQIQKKALSDIDEATIKNIAERTTGVSIAVLQNVLDLAFRAAEKQGRKPRGSDLLTALEEYNFGEKKQWSKEYYESVAIHESGHAYIAYLSGEKPSYITIESRGNFGGYMQHENAEEKPNYTKEELIWKIRCSLGGRAAEEVFFGKKASLNTGTASDLQNATRYAGSILCDYGMIENQFVAIPFEKILQTNLAASYLDQVNALIAGEMKTTVDLIEKGKDKVRKLADALLSENNLTGDKISDILKDE